MSDAPERIGLVANPFGYSLWNSVDYDDPEIAIGYVRADLHEALVKERDEALEELGRVIMACPPGFRKSPASEGVKELRAARDTLAADKAELLAALEPLLQNVGDGIANVFDQLVKGNWQDDHGHDVKKNVHMLHLKDILVQMMQFRTKHLDYSEPDLARHAASAKGEV